MFPKRLGTREALEIWMALANFERLPTKTKTEIGRLLLKKFKTTQPNGQELWALSRLGARHAMYGPLDRLIPSAETTAWLDTLLALKLDRSERTAHTLVHLARYTGDRARDLPEAARDKVARWLAQAPNAERYQELLTNPESALRRDEQAWMFGESLPAGLVLFSAPSDDE